MTPAAPRILVVNAGSTSVKLRVVAGDEVEDRRDLGPPGDDLAEGLTDFLAGAGHLDATAHRLVHGGAHFSVAVRIDPGVRAALDQVTALAPVHNPPGLAGIDALLRLRPGLPAVACFDTTFHTTLAAEAAAYAIPAEWADRWGIRRYGFHGLSCAWATAHAARLLGSPAAGYRMVICHLGGGASVTAVAGGRSVDTTMGFSPLEGLVMATRSGDVDPAAVLWLVDQGLSHAEVNDGLERRSGLLGLSGRTGDMRELLAARDPRAAFALDVYLHRLRAKIAAMATAMGGLDVLVFTGGVGEHAAAIRARACAGLGWLGVAVDDAANGADSPADRDISAAGCRVRCLVIAAREELQMAGEARAVLWGAGGGEGAGGG